MTPNPVRRRSLAWLAAVEHGSGGDGLHTVVRLCLARVGRCRHMSHRGEAVRVPAPVPQALRRGADVPTMELVELDEARDMASYANEEVDALAQIAVKIGRQLGEASAHEGLAAVIEYAEDLEALAEFAASAERLLAADEPRLSLSLGGFRLRLFQIIDAISDAFDEDDVRMASTLFRRRLAPALLDYHSIAAAVETGLASSARAA